MFTTNAFFEGYNKKDRSLCFFERHDGPVSPLKPLPAVFHARHLTVYFR